MQKEPEYELLEPGRLRLFRDRTQRLRLTINGDRSYLDVKVVRAFPLSLPERYIGFLDGKDRVIGLLVDPAQMDAESQRAAAQALQRHYFVPTITRIHAMREEFGAIYCDVSTNYGRRRFVAKGIRDAIEDLGEGQFLIPDVDGNRYRVADWRDMDARSRRLLERVL